MILSLRYYVNCHQWGDGQAFILDCYFLPKFMAVSAAFASSQRVLGLHVTLPVGSSVLEALQTHSQIFFSKPRDVWNH